MAATLLGYEGSQIVNLLDVPTRDVTEIAVVATEREVWLRSRPPVATALDSCAAVLMAWGVSAPTGQARVHRSAQIEWVLEEVQTRGLPAWWVGGAPRHPSRWQRLTFRRHGGEPFREALAASLQPVGTQ